MPSDSWEKLVQASAKEFSEADLLELSWETLRSVCDHYRISNAIDIAKVELHWKRNQTSHLVADYSASASNVIASQHIETGVHSQNQRTAHAGEKALNGKRTSMHRSSISTQVESSLQNSSSMVRSSSLLKGGSEVSAPVPSDLLTLFESFCLFGVGNSAVNELDGAKCVKLCRDVGIIGTKIGLSSTDVELIFAKIRRKGERKISYAEFRIGFIPEVAMRSRRSVEDIVSLCEKCGGPSVQATKTDSVRFYDEAQR